MSADFEKNAIAAANSVEAATAATQAGQHMNTPQHGFGIAFIHALAAVRTADALESIAASLAKIAAGGNVAEDGTVG